MRSGTFSMSGLTKDTCEVFVDETEQEIERPNKRQRTHDSGKKNATLKKHRY